MRGRAEQGGRGEKKERKAVYFFDPISDVTVGEKGRITVRSYE